MEEFCNGSLNDFGNPQQRLNGDNLFPALDFA